MGRRSTRSSSAIASSKPPNCVTDVCAAGASASPLRAPPSESPLRSSASPRAWRFCCRRSVTLLVSFVLRSSGRRAADAQVKALADAGAESYLEFRFQPVKGLLSSDQNRKLLRCAAEEHALATADWKSLAGDIEVDWALEHRDEIVGAARLRHDMSALGAVSSTAPDMDDDRTTELARALVGRLAPVAPLRTRRRELPADPRRSVRGSRRRHAVSGARSAPALVRLATDHLPHRRRRRRLVGAARGAHRRAQPHRAGERPRGTDGARGSTTPSRFDAGPAPRWSFAGRPSKGDRCTTS